MGGARPQKWHVSQAATASCIGGLLSPTHLCHLLPLSPGETEGKHGMPRGGQKREGLVAMPLPYSHSTYPLAAPSAAKQMALIIQKGWVQITRRSHHTADLYHLNARFLHSSMKSFGHTQPHQESELYQCSCSTLDTLLRSIQSNTFGPHGVPGMEVPCLSPSL